MNLVPNLMVGFAKSKQTREIGAGYGLGRIKVQYKLAYPYRGTLIAVTICLLIYHLNRTQVDGAVLMRVCDTKEIKTVTNRVCMLYKRTKNSDIRMDKFGNIRITRGVKGEYSPSKLASDCCKIGCPPHIFAYNC